MHVGFKQEDLLTTEITITKEEREAMQKDITITNTRQQRMQMAMKDVVKQYSCTRIDER